MALGLAQSEDNDVIVQIVFPGDCRINLHTSQGLHRKIYESEHLDYFRAMATITNPSVYPSLIYDTAKNKETGAMRLVSTRTMRDLQQGGGTSKDSQGKVSSTGNLVDGRSTVLGGSGGSTGRSRGA